MPSTEERRSPLLPVPAWLLCCLLGRGVVVCGRTASLRELALLCGTVVCGRAMPPPPPVTLARRSGDGVLPRSALGRSGCRSIFPIVAGLLLPRS